MEGECVEAGEAQGPERGRGAKATGPSHTQSRPTSQPGAYRCGDWSGVCRGVGLGSGAYPYAHKGEVLPWRAS